MSVRTVYIETKLGYARGDEKVRPTKVGRRGRKLWSPDAWSCERIPLVIGLVQDH